MKTMQTKRNLLNLKECFATFQNSTSQQIHAISGCLLVILTSSCLQLLRHIALNARNNFFLNATSVLSGSVAGSVPFLPDPIPVLKNWIRIQILL